MDYKYIEQLVERYFEGETSLEEEAILHNFFSQPEIPGGLEKYRPLFVRDGREEPLDDAFDERILALTEGQQSVTKAIIVRLKPLFKAAAIVAIILTLGNAAQAPWNYGWDSPENEYAKYHDLEDDSLKMLTPVQAENISDSAATIISNP